MVIDVSAIIAMPASEEANGHEDGPTRHRIQAAFYEHASVLANASIQNTTTL